MSRNDRTVAATTRRSFLKTGSALAGLGALGTTGCDALSLDPGGQDGDGGGDTSSRKATESPMLTQQVKSGELPPLEERLPDNPATVQVVEEPGDYGGEWRGALFYGTGGLSRTVDYDFLARWHSDEPAGIPQPVPNIAEQIEGSDDGSEWTITLRRGMKWSDGEPFTADDLVFAQNDVLNNTDVTPVAPWSATAEKIDDQTVVLTFDPPDGLFLARQAGPLGNRLVGYPMHYLQQFHLDYNPDVEQLAAESDFDKWTDFFFDRANWLANPDLPRLSPWHALNAYGADASNRLQFERNPYYWKTDPDGRQLPYIDRATFTELNTPEVGVVQASEGQLDFVERTINTLRNKPVFADNRETGDIRFFDRVSASENFTIICLNLTHKNQVKRELFNNLDFRIGLSYAINRQEIIDTVFKGLAEPWQAAPRPESPYFDEEFAKQYTEYDVDRANQHLDRVVPDKDDSGVRLGPDGKRISFDIEYATSFYPEWVDSLELVREYWADVGIQVNVKPMDRNLLYERKEANEHDANVWEGAAAFRDDVLLEPRWYFPFSGESNYATPWAAWFSSRGEGGEEPPPNTQRQMELYRQLEQTPDASEQDRLMKEILQIAKEEFYVIGINSFPDGYGLVTNRFRNVPKMLASWIYQPPGMTDPEQYYIRADEQ